MKPFLSKINFALNRNPRIERAKDYRSIIPAPYKAVITITADFELAWAWRYSKSNNNALESASLYAKRERKNIPNILYLCDKYNIPITWATVGHLFLSSCARINGIAHPEIPTVNKYQGPFWDFQNDDWFEYDPCSNYKEAPEWYAPDLIEMILKSKVNHEIGCHTFSHIDCRDEVCSTALFEAELNECKKEAAKLGLELKSFVHPGHTIGNLNKLAELGFNSFQTDPGNILGYPVKHKNGLWELRRTYELAWRQGWSVEYHVYRYKTIIDRAIKYNTVCNLWFHPSFDQSFLNKVLPAIFDYLNLLRENVWITNVDNHVEWLNEKY